MDLTKLQGAVAELEAEAERCKRLADELRAVIKRSTHGASLPLPAEGKASHFVPGQRRLRLRHREGQKSVRALALEILKKQHKPVHVDDLVGMINAEREDPTNRAAVESQLTRVLAKKILGLKRTAPGTFAVE